MTSKRIAKKASKEGRTAKDKADRQVAMSALSQARKRKPNCGKRKSARTRKS